MKSAVQANFLFLTYKNVVENVTDLVSQSHRCHVVYCPNIADNIDALFNSECKWSLVIIRKPCCANCEGIVTVISTIDSQDRVTK